MCTPKCSLSVSAEWQRELWATDTSSEGGLALYDATEVAARPHGLPSGRLAVTTATPEASDDIAFLNRSSTEVSTWSAKPSS
jgi:hypothetical protein